MCDNNATAQEMCANIYAEIQMLRRKLLNTEPEYISQEWDRNLSRMCEQINSIRVALDSVPECPEGVYADECDGDDGQPDEWQEWHDYDPDC